MEPQIRGALEKVMDIVVDENFLKPYLQLCIKLKNEGAIDSIKSAVIGAIHTYALNFYLGIKRDRKERISEKEEKEFDEIFLRRVPEIKSKLNILLNL